MKAANQITGLVVPRLIVEFDWSLRDRPATAKISGPPSDRPTEAQMPIRNTQIRVPRSRYSNKNSPLRVRAAENDSPLLWGCRAHDPDLDENRSAGRFQPNSS